MRLAAQPKKSTTGEVRRAVQQMEAQLRATRQDALQLATAVVRLEKEKAVLQTQLSGQDGGVTSEIPTPPSPPFPLPPLGALRVCRQSGSFQQCRGLTLTGFVLSYRH